MVDSISVFASAFRHIEGSIRVLVQHFKISNRFFHKRNANRYSDFFILNLQLTQAVTELLCQAADIAFIIFASHKNQELVAAKAPCKRPVSKHLWGNTANFL